MNGMSINWVLYDGHWSCPISSSDIRGMVKQPRGRSREDRGANMGQPLINNPPFGESWHTTNKIVFFLGNGVLMFIIEVPSQ